MAPLLPIAVAAGALWYFSRKKTFAFEPITGGVTGKKWLTRVVGITGAGDAKKTLVEVWSPAGTYGPHLQVLVLTYEQTGSDKNSRVNKGVGPQAIPIMVTDAGKDFGVRQPAGVTVSGVPRPDAVARILDRTGRQVGRTELYHGGDHWAWTAAFNNGRPIAQGTSSTPNQAHRNATTNALRRIDSDRRKARIMKSIS